MWKTVKLEKVCKIISGNSIPAKKKEENFTGVEGMPYVATKDVGFDGSINYENGVCIPDEYRNNFKISLAGATLVCAEGGSAGRKIAFSNEDCCFVNKLFSLQPDKNIIPKFVYYYTLSSEFQSQFKEAMHGLIGGVSLSKIRGFFISIPPLAEQQRIVAKLDAAFAEIDMAIELTEAKEAEIKKLQAAFLSKSLNEETVTWKTVKLVDVCELAYGKALDKSDRLDSDGVPVFGANGIKAYAKKSLFNEPSIIVGRKGSAGEINKVVEPFWALDVAFYTKINKEIITLDFLFYTLTALNLPSMAKGVKPGINRNEVYDKNILLPTIDEQKNIITKLNTAFTEIEAAHISIKKKKENYEALKSAILAQELQSEAA